MRIATLFALGFLLNSCVSSSVPERVNGAGVDHIVVGVASLESGVAAFEQMTGVRPLYGGQHPGRGTENALVALGRNEYLELIAARPGADVSGPLAALRSLKKPTVIDWAIHVSDQEQARSILQGAGFVLSESVPGARETPSGQRLEWIVFRVQKPQIDTAPFFIRWGERSAHPATTSPGGCALRRIEIVDSNAESLERLLHRVAAGVEVRAGAKPHLSVAIRCPKGEVTLSSD